MAQGFWLVKSEPSVYSWQRFVKDKRTVWDGIRSCEARNNLRAMKKGDLVLFYHSNEGKDVVGLARVVREAYPDQTATDGDWSAVDLVPHEKLSSPVSLSAIKADPKLSELELIRRPRLSVVPVSAAHFKRILTLAKTSL
jgi:predicted RNA-binding protein with PUA-like domain